MFDDLCAYLNENVWESYQAFVEARKSRTAGKSRDLRLAINVASALYHFREHFPKAERKTRSELAKICPDYDLLGDIVNVSKHGQLTQGMPRLDDAENIYELHTSTMYSDELGEYWHAEKSVYARLNDGSERDLYEVLTNVLNMWLVELHSIGAIPSTAPRPIERKIGIPARSSETGPAPLDLEILQGVRFTHRIRLQKHNYETNQIEPFDLTGGQVKFRIYKPQELVVCLRNDKTGEEIVNVIPLTEKETERLMELNSEDERSTFVRAVIDKHGINTKQKSEQDLEPVPVEPFVAGKVVVEPRKL